MIRVPPENFKNLFPLFDADTPKSTALFSVLEGNTAGMAFADNPQNPRQCVVYSNAYFTFLSKHIDQKFFNDVFRYLNKNYPILLVQPAPTNGSIKFPAKPPRKINCLEFSDRPLGGTPYDEKWKELPEGLRIQKIDASILPRCLWAQQAIKAYGGIEPFLRKGLGFCLMQADEVLAESYAVFFGKGQMERTTFTKKEHRGHNYGTYIGYHLVDTYEKMGFRAYLTCDRNNMATLAAIRHLGYRQGTPYTLLQYPSLTKRAAEFFEDQHYFQVSDHIAAVGFQAHSQHLKLQNDTTEFEMISDSMFPILRRKDKLLLEPVSAETLHCGDIIVFKYGDGLTAHRFLKRLDPARILTKGDSLAQTDIPVLSEDIFARVAKIVRSGGVIDLGSAFFKISHALLGIAHRYETENNFFKSTWLAPFLKTFVKALNPFYRSQTKDFSKEKSLLCLLSGKELTPSHAQQINHILEEWVDFHYFFKAVLYNATGSLVYQNLEKIRNPVFPAWLKDDLKKLYDEAAAKNTQTLADVARLARAFEKHHIPLLVLKGAALVGQIFRDVALRPMQDVDCLVKKSDWADIRRVLAEIGFFNRQGLDLLKLEELARIPLDWQVCYENIRGTKIEFKFNLFVLDLPAFSPVENYWTEACRIKVSGQEVQTLSAEDHFLYLATRMANVGFRQLLWFIELKEFTKACPQLHWEKVVAKAKLKKVEALLFFTLRILKQDFKVDIPENILSALTPSAATMALSCLFFGKTGFGGRDPLALRKNPNLLLIALFLLGKFKADKISLRYLFYFAFPRLAYMAYRYRLAKWKVLLGAGYIQRWGVFLKEAARILKPSFKAYS